MTAYSILTEKKTHSYVLINNSKKEIKEQNEIFNIFLKVTFYW